MVIFLTIVILAVTLGTGMVAGAIVLWLLLPGRLKHHIDYKQRWEKAVTLLGTQGQLTDEQVRQLQGPVAVVQAAPADDLRGVATRQPWLEAGSISLPAAALPVSGVAVPAGGTGAAPVAGKPSAATLRLLHTMAPWDRRDAEIARARAGQAPLDDLWDMPTWDIRDVLEARSRYGTGE